MGISVWNYSKTSFVSVVSIGGVMFVVEKIPRLKTVNTQVLFYNTFTVFCYENAKNMYKKNYLYAIKNLTQEELAQFMLGRGNEYVDDELKDVFTLTNIRRCYINDQGRLSAVMPL